MPRIHGLQHIECFGTTTLANDDAVRAHAQCIGDEVAYGDHAPALGVGKPRFEPDDVWMLVEPELGAVFDRDDALLVGDEA